MRGSYFNYLPQAGNTTDAVEEACARRREECELRLAKLTNGVDPDTINRPVKQPRRKKKGKPMNNSK